MPEKPQELVVTAILMEDFSDGGKELRAFSQPLGVYVRFEPRGFADPDLKSWTVTAPSENPATLFGVDWHDVETASPEDSRYFAFIDLQNGTGMCIYMTEKAFVGLYRDCHEHYKRLAIHRRNQAQKGRSVADDQPAGS